MAKTFNLYNAGPRSRKVVTFGNIDRNKSGAVVRDEVMPLMIINAGQMKTMASKALLQLTRMVYKEAQAQISGDKSGIGLSELASKQTVDKVAVKPGLRRKKHSGAVRDKGRGINRMTRFEYSRQKLEGTVGFTGSAHSRAEWGKKYLLGEDTRTSKRQARLMFATAGKQRNKSIRNKLLAMGVAAMRGESYRKEKRDIFTDTFARTKAKYQGFYELSLAREMNEISAETFTMLSSTAMGVQQAASRARAIGMKK